MMEVASLGAGANGQIPSPTPPASIDSTLFLRHLASLLEITLGASREDLEAKGSLLSDVKRNDTIQRCMRFTSDSQVAVYIQKDLTGSASLNGDSNGYNSTGWDIARVQVRRADHL